MGLHLQVVAKLIRSRCGEHCNTDLLMGPHNADVRQEIMQALGYGKLPKAKCGINELEKVLVKAFGITEWTCAADRHNKLADAIAAVNVQRSVL